MERKFIRVHSIKGNAAFVNVDKIQCVSFGDGLVTRIWFGENDYMDVGESVEKVMELIKK